MLLLHPGSIRSLPRTDIISAVRREPGGALTDKDDYFRSGTGLRDRDFNTRVAHLPAIEGETNRDRFKRSHVPPGRGQVWKRPRGHEGWKPTVCAGQGSGCARSLSCPKA